MKRRLVNLVSLSAVPDAPAHSKDAKRRRVNAKA
jgi:hypothetical protein